MKEKKATFFGKVSNFSAVVSQKMEHAKDVAGNIHVPGRINKAKCFTLLVIDDSNTDWSKYFRGRRIHGQYDILVEQAEFRDISVQANSLTGVTASIVTQQKGNTKAYKSFKPDFLLVRQNLRDASEDYRGLLLGFQYGEVPSVNTLESIYNFQDKPWVYAQMLKAQKKLGQDNFPLIEQTFFPNQQEMQSFSRYPCVFKVGHAHSGVGKVRVENAASFQDVTSLIWMSNSYCTVEPYIDAKFDLHVQKIGNNYKALMRKSLSGNWKTNIGQSILEEIPITDKHKTWIDAMSEMFGGLGICSLEAVVGKDGKEFIIEVNDCATTLLGESQEEDRRNIAELVLQQMEEKLKPPQADVPATESTPAAATAAATAAVESKVEKPFLTGGSRAASKGSLLNPEGGSSMASTVLDMVSRKQPAAAPSPTAASNVTDQRKTSSSSGVSSASSSVAGTSTTVKIPPPVPALPAIIRDKSPNGSQNSSAVANNHRARHDSQDSTDSSDSSASESSTVSGVSSASSSVKKGPETTPEVKTGNGKEASNPDAPEVAAVEGEDTMKNLRKTFAGIFGDLQ